MPGSRTPSNTWPRPWPGQRHRSPSIGLAISCSASCWYWPGWPPSSFRTCPPSPPRLRLAGSSYFPAWPSSCTPFPRETGAAFFLMLLFGLLHLIVGGYLALLPLTGILTLTILIAALLIADGLLEVGMALRLRPQEGWGWILLSGLVAIAAGLLIALQLPNSATWTIGLIVGIKMIFAGWAFITLALAAHRPEAPASLRAV